MPHLDNRFHATIPKGALPKQVEEKPTSSAGKKSYQIESGGLFHASYSANSNKTYTYT